MQRCRVGEKRERQKQRFGPNHLPFAPPVPAGALLPVFHMKKVLSLRPTRRDAFFAPYLWFGSYGSAAIDGAVGPSQTSDLKSETRGGPSSHLQSSAMKIKRRFWSNFDPIWFTFGSLLV